MKSLLHRVRHLIHNLGILIIDINSSTSLFTDHLVKEKLSLIRKALSLRRRIRAAIKDNVRGAHLLYYNVYKPSSFTTPTIKLPLSTPAQAIANTPSFTLQNRFTLGPPHLNPTPFLST